MTASDARRAEARESAFFTKHLKDTDPEVWDAVEHEYERQQNEIELIASENIVSQAVLDAAGTLLTNKYAEGYPGRRYYGGCQYVDVVEQLAIDRAKRLFNCAFANVQPHSGSQANQSVLLALIKPGDTIMGMSLAAGGHLTHGARAQPVRQMVQRRAIRRAPRRSPHRLRRGRAARQGAQAGHDHRRRLGLSAHHRLRALPPDRRLASAPISWSTWRISPAWSPRGCIRARCRTPMSSPPPRTRRCAARAAAWCSPTTRRSARRSTRRCSPASRAAR